MTSGNRKDIYHDDHSFIFKIAGQKILPTSPPILEHLIDICSQPSADLEKIAKLVQMDPALSLKMIGLAHTRGQPFEAFNAPVEAAIRSLGAQPVLNMATGVAGDLFFGRTDAESFKMLRDYWRHSYLCAVLAELIAKEVQYPQSGEAYLAGLWHDLGKLVLWANFPNKYDMNAFGDHPLSQVVASEEEKVGVNHCEVAARLIRQRTPYSFLADAVLFHHCTAEQIATAFPIVKILYAANRLAHAGPDGAKDLKVADRPLLPVPVATIEELASIARIKAKRHWQAFGMKADAATGQKSMGTGPVGSSSFLKRQLRANTLCAVLAQNLISAPDENQIVADTMETLRLGLDIDSVYCFLLTPKSSALVGRHDDHNPRSRTIAGLELSLKNSASSIVSAFNDQKIIDSFSSSREPAANLSDLQLIHAFGKEGLLCVPMGSERTCVGVLVIAIDKVQSYYLSKQAKYLKTIALLAGKALFAEQQRRHQDRPPSLPPAPSEWVLDRKKSHEINNPLGIVNNYLKVLEAKLAKQNLDFKEIKIIQEEMERIGRIINLNTTQPASTYIKKKLVDLNTLLKQISQLLKGTLTKSDTIEFQLALDPSIPETNLDIDYVKQIFINLIKNAMEALSEGGTILIKTFFSPAPFESEPDSATVSPQGFIHILIKDDGPGIPDKMLRNIWEPFVTSKHSHEGLGLSIVKDLLAQLNGDIRCESSPKGTQFTVQLPVG